MSKTYKTGQYPQVGDVLELTDIYGLPYYTNLKRDREYVVTAIQQGTKSTLVVLKSLSSGAVKASRFSLVKTLEGAKSVTPAPVRFRVVSSTGQLVANAPEPAQLKTQLEKLLLENPGKSFEVYQYMATAAAKMPEVELIDRTPTAPEPVGPIPVPVQNFVNVQPMFSKR